ncbi:MAG: acetolactate synthase large subunit, partial [Arcanobacterium sp.]|nr:acetolactate synthase large subunit [Arcanobacterium sp.]
MAQESEAPAPGSPAYCGSEKAIREKSNGARSIVRTLEELGVETVFGIPGGAILPTFDALYHTKKLNYVLTRHEQGAGHAAEGYAVSTGKVGVALVTSGPGATNLVTSFLDANLDSVPMVAITGQVGAAAIGTDAFQEADIIGSTLPL